MMTIKELERLSDLLMKWHEEHPDESAMRDDVSHLRANIEDEIDERT